SRLVADDVSAIVVVAAELALAVLVGVAPQVGGVNTRMSRPVAPAVETLAKEEGGRDGPVIPLVQALKPKPVHSRLLPRGRVAGAGRLLRVGLGVGDWPAGRYLQCTGGEGVAVVQMRGKTQAALQRVGQRHEPPRHRTDLPGYLLVPLAVHDDSGHK